MSSVVAFAAGKVASAVSAMSSFYMDINPATLSGAADVIVVKRGDDLYCSPFYVRFGKLKLWRPFEKTVEIRINDKPTNLVMRIDEAGEAFFDMDTNDSLDIATIPGAQSDLLYQTASTKSTKPLYSGEDPSTLADEILVPRSKDDSASMFLRLNCSQSTVPLLESTEPLVMPVSGAETGVFRNNSLVNPRRHTVPCGTRPSFISKNYEVSSAYFYENISADQAIHTESKLNPCKNPLGAQHQHLASKHKKQETPSSPSGTKRRLNSTQGSSSQRESDNPGTSNCSTSQSQLSLDLDAVRTQFKNLLEVGYKHPSVEVAVVDFEMIKSLPQEKAFFKFQETLVPSEDLDIYTQDINRSNLVAKVGDIYFNLSLVLDSTSSDTNLPSDSLLERNHIVILPPNTSPQPKSRGTKSLKSWWFKPAKNHYRGVKKKKTQRGALSATPPRGSPDTQQKPVVPVLEKPSRNKSTKRNRYAISKSTLENIHKTNCLTSKQLKTLNLNHGPNKVLFTVKNSGFRGAVSCSAKIFLWNEDVRIVISDVDGTITKSDALGHIFNMVGKDWTHAGIARLYTSIQNNGYHIMYLTSRSLGQATSTREYLENVSQDGVKLPEGPVIMSPDRLFTSIHREVILKKPEEFKVFCLRFLKRILGDKASFYAGFGNKITDALSYRSVDVPSSRIFTINSHVKIRLVFMQHYRLSYIKINDMVNEIFPPLVIPPLEKPEYNDWLFWR